MKARVRKVLEALSPSPDALLIANSVDPHIDQSFYYFLDVPSGLFERAVEIGLPDGRLHVLTSQLEEETARQAARHDPSVEVTMVADREAQDRELAKLLPKSGTFGLNFHELTHETYLALGKALPGATFVDASASIKKARMIKDAVEIERLERAGSIGSKVALEIPKMLRRGMTELELAAQIEQHMMALGASSSSFKTIVGFGPNSAEPHYFAGERRLEPGVSMVCDFGAYYRRYASDITRSFHFGPTDEELKRVHETVESAQQAALAVVRAGVPAKEVHLAAAKVINASPWKGKFTHGLGHSIGLAVHDGFSMNHTVEEPLEAGLAVTVEPGIYLPGHGGVRIEDDILVTETGYRFLTTAPRSYLEVPA